MRITYDDHTMAQVGSINQNLFYSLSARLPVQTGLLDGNNKWLVYTSASADRTVRWQQ